MRDPVESLQVYGFDRFEDIDGHIVDQNIITWLHEKLQENKATIQHWSDEASAQVLWGDVQGSVVCTNDGQLYFFDFEHAHIGYGSDLSYLKIHGSFNTQQLSTIVETYANLSGRTQAELWKQIKQDEQITRVNDVVWAARQWSLTNEDSFKELTYARKN